MKRIRFGLIPALFATAAAIAGAQTPSSATTSPAPTPVPTPAPPSAAALKEGKELFAKVIESLGGKEKVAKVHDMQTRGQVSTKGPQGDVSMDIQTYVVFPDHLSQQVDAPFGRLVMVATPSGAFVVGPTGPMDLPPDLREELLRQILRTSLFLGQKADDPKLSVAASGVEKIGEVDAHILDVTYEDSRVRWFVDPKTGRILRSSHVSQTPDHKEISVVSDYSDFHLVDGYSIPFLLEVNSGGKKDQTLKIEECKINAGIDPKYFEKPAPPTRAPAPPPVTPNP
jgi:hypothetical protein